MPVYGYGVLGAPWTLCKNLDVKILIKFINIVKKVALEEFKTDEVFRNSIIYNSKLESCFIASYDMSKTNIELYYYQERVEKVIKKSNEILSKNKKYDKYKFDICGNWNIGKIVIMEKK